MVKRIFNIALAYVGVVIGAGLSSGQDLMQYFVGFGKWGIIGTIVLGIISVIIVDAQDIKSDIKELLKDELSENNK
jgi:membrane protein